MAIEEEFSIEIPDKDADSIHSGALGLSIILSCLKKRRQKQRQRKRKKKHFELLRLYPTQHPHANTLHSRKSSRVHPLPTRRTLNVPEHLPLQGWKTRKKNADENKGE